MKERNRWKMAFFSLLFILVIFVVVMAYLIFAPGHSNPIPKISLDNKKYVQFHIKTNKDDLNQLINRYIEKEGLNGPIRYSVFLKNDVELHGSIPVFSENIQLKMDFTPEALNNGDLILKQKSISIGNLNLPPAFVLNLVKNSYKMPDWVMIQPNKKVVYVGLQEMKIGKSNMRARIDHFNLKEDDISFSLLLPTE